jgi:hypothetical protein
MRTCVNCYAPRLVPGKPGSSGHRRCEAIRSGVIGYVRKTEMATELMPTIEAALRGKSRVLGMRAEGRACDRGSAKGEMGEG